MEGMLGGVLGLAGAGMQAANAAQANIINWLNLQFQKQNANRQFKLSTAARTDAYGNKQKYDDLLNEWETQLTPVQGQIIKAGENEQLKSLTEDAQRNRQIRETQHARGIAAGDDYDRTLADYRYNGPKSELSTRDELTNLLAGVQSEKARSSQTELIRTALREGKGGDISSIINAANNDMGSTLAQTMLQARDMAKKEHTSEVASHESTHLPVLQQLISTMDMGGDMPVRFSDTPDKLASLQSEQFKGILQALTNEGSQVGGAYKNLADSYRASGPDLKGLAALFGGIGKMSGGGGRSSAPAYSLLDDSYDDRTSDNYGDY